MPVAKHLSDDRFQIVLNDLMLDGEAAHGIKVVQPRHRLVALDGRESELLVEHMDVPYQAQLREQID